MNRNNALLPTVKRRLEAWNVPADARLLVAVSGGPDSMVLADVLHRAGWSLHLIHFNYGIRTKAADADEALVRQWAQQRNIPLEVHHPTRPPASSRNESFQAWARRIRYDGSFSLMKRHRLRYLLTAHHRHDLVETMLWQWMHAGTPWHVRGFPPRQTFREEPYRLLRPFYDIDRDRILSHAAQYHVPFRQDSSNRHIRYRRNFLRQYVLPELKFIQPGLDARMLALSENARQLYQWWESACRQWKAAHVRESDDKVSISWEALIRHPAPQLLLSYLLTPYGFSPAQAADLLRSRQAGARIYSSRWVAERTATAIALYPAQAESSPHRLVIYSPDIRTLQWADYEIAITRHKADAISVTGDPWTAFLDAAAVAYPWTLRHPQPGDRFQPLGMAHPMLVSDFLTNRKVPRRQKEQTWLLETPHGIVWIIGHRIAHWARIRPQTRQVLKISVQPRREVP